MKPFVLEALCYEFKNTAVEILALCPGASRTAFNKSANEKNGMDVSEVVSIGLSTLGKRPSVIAGVKNSFLVWILRFLDSKAKIALGAKIVVVD